MKRNARKATLFLFVLMTAMAASTTFAGILLENQIPVVSNGAITVDGNIDDWSGIEPFETDPSGDVCIPNEIQANSNEIDGTDFTAYYLARDNDYLYWRVDIYGDSFNLSDGNGEYGPILDFYDTNRSCSNTGYPNGVTTQIVGTISQGAYISTRTDCDDWAGWGGGTGYGTISGSHAEGKIPLTLFEQYNINSILVFMYASYNGQTTSCIDRDFFPNRYLEVPPLRVLTNHWAFGENSGFVDKYHAASYFVAGPNMNFDPATDTAKIEWNSEDFIYEFLPGFTTVVGSSPFMFTFLCPPQATPPDLLPLENSTFSFSVGDHLSNYKFSIPTGSLHWIDVPYAIYDQSSRKLKWEPVSGVESYSVRIYPPLADGSPDHFNPIYSVNLNSNTNEFTLPSEAPTEPGNFVAVQANEAVSDPYARNFARFHIKIPDTFTIGLFYVQHREYEKEEYHGEYSHEKIIHRILIEMKNSHGETITENVIDSCHLYDPNGDEVELDDFRYRTDRTWYKNYYSFNGQWVFNNDAFNDTGYYYAEFGAQLLAGVYTLEVNDIYGRSYTATKEFSPLQNFPIAKSIKQKYGKDGNLILSWHAPDVLTPFSEDPSREVYADVAIFLNNPDYEYIYFYLRVPFHMNQAVIPKHIIEKIIAEGEDPEITIQLRTKDQNYRSYSKYVKLKKAKGFFVNNPCSFCSQ